MFSRVIIKLLYFITTIICIIEAYDETTKQDNVALVFDQSSLRLQTRPPLDQRRGSGVDKDTRRREQRRRLKEERKQERKDRKKDKKRDKTDMGISESVYNNAINPIVGSVHLNHRVTPIYPRPPPVQVTSDMVTSAIYNQQDNLDVGWLMSNISALWQVVRKLEKNIGQHKQSNTGGGGGGGGGGRSSNRGAGKVTKVITPACDNLLHPSVCIQEGDTAVCSDKGNCQCGVCECTAPSYGQFCQCDDYNCPKYNGMKCGGPYRGQCRCGRCLCRPGYTGESCDCSIDTAACIPPHDSSNICSNRGTCKCGRCQCEDGYKGTYCQDNVYAAGICERLKACVLCKAFGRKLPQCQDCKITVQTVDELETTLTTCVMVSRGCLFKYSYTPDGPDAYVVNVPNHKSCVPPQL